MSAKPGAGDKRPIIIVKKKKGGGHGHHGGAWKVAYADFVTAMMALFIVLWLLTQADAKLKQQLAQFFRNPGIMPGGAAINNVPASSKSDRSNMMGSDVTIVMGNRPTGDALAEQASLEQGAEEVKEAVKQLGKESPDLSEMNNEVAVEVTPEGLSIEMIDKGKDILFDSASADLKPGLVALLKKLAPMLGKMPNGVQVGGHTDARPYKAAGKSNWDLSFDRANKARQVLEASGLRPGQSARVLSYASSEPANPRDPMASENRRLTILALRRVKVQ